tara:strand:+ start:395 stop:2317 length:1923 start_codon:yes stop_codon:yes gene_type:complete
MPQEPSNSNLAHIGIDKTTELSLENNWAFYWNELITPNNFTENDKYELVSLKNWTNFTLSNAGKLPSLGYATYRKTVTIAKDRVAVSLYIPKIYAASKVFINGTFISEIGVVGKTKEEALHRRFSQIIPLNTNETTFEIVIQVANFYHQKGGISEPIIIGDSQHLYGKKIKLVIADMIFIGCLGFIGFFFLFFFLLYWNKDHAVIYFAIMCISLSYMALSDRYAPLTQVFETISWVFLTKIEYISLFLGGTAGSLFFNDIFKRFSHKLYAKLLKFVFYILALLVIFLPAPHFTKLLLPFLVLMILNLCYVGFVIVKAILAKRYESILLLISMLLGSVIFTIHIFFFLDQNQFAIIFVNFGYVVVFLLLSMLLMTRFSRAFKQLERSRALALKQKQEITTQSDKLSAANLKLEENLILLENYNTELDDFNHIVSHDLKSPLVSVYSLASFIEEDLKDSLDENTKNHIHLLKGVVSKMEALINGLLQYSKVAKGNKTKTTFSLNKLLTKVVGVVDYQNKSTIIVPEKDLEICANETELNHVFQNLISNAIKHNDKEKAIIKISVTKHAKEYLFTIKDNGPGIEAQYHDKIFKIFSQLKLSDDVESTGVGLAIVKKIITQNKGIITLSSEKEKGLTLQFTWAI